MMLVDTPEGLLFLQRAAHKSSPFKWAPPAGHIKEGETALDAAIRELSEETGLTWSTPPKSIGRVVNETFDVEVFYIRFEEKVNVRISDEHVGHAFVPMNSLKEQFSEERVSLLRDSTGPKNASDYTKTTQQLFNAAFAGRIAIPARQRLKT